MSGNGDIAINEPPEVCIPFQLDPNGVAAWPLFQCRRALETRNHSGGRDRAITSHLFG
jgi:hypothetical protein